jgi:uncharacterized glyoxalase superfamily protein PhnB
MNPSRRIPLTPHTRLGSSDSVTLWFRVDDIEATFLRCLESGATARYEPVEKPFGDTVAALVDPHGNHFGLSQRVER